MILVTAGTTMPFDELFEEVDRLAALDAFGERVVCQTGQSRYEMRHCEAFRAMPSLREVMAESSLVVTHGGATVIELLHARKPFVAFPNPRGAGDHQGRFLERCARIAPVSWSRDVRDLLPLVEARRRAGPAAINADLPRLSDLLLDEIRALG